MYTTISSISFQFISTVKFGVLQEKYKLSFDTKNLKTMKKQKQKKKNMDQTALNLYTWVLNATAKSQIFSAFPKLKSSLPYLNLFYFHYFYIGIFQLFKSFWKFEFSLSYSVWKVH